MRCIIVALAVVFNILTFSCAYAKDVIIEAVGEYTVGDSESKLIGKQRAIDEAMRYASEKAGVYVESYSKTNMGMLTADEVKVISANILKLTKEPIIETVVTNNGDIRIIAKIVAIVDVDSINRNIKNTLFEKYKSKEIREDITNKRANNDLTAEVYFYKALNYYNNKNITEAIRFYTQAIQLNPNYLMAYEYRAVAYGDIGEYDNIIQDCMMIITLSNKTKNNYPLEYTYNNLGSAYTSKKDYQNAFKCYSNAISINPKYITPYINRAYSYHKLGDLNKAMHDCNAALKMDSKDKRIYSIRGLIYWNLEEYDKAISDYTQVIKLHPEYEAYYMIGYCYFKQKKYKDAIKSFNDSILLNMKYSNNYFMRGRSYEELNRYDEAYSDYKKAIELNPNEVMYVKTLDELCEKMK